MKCDRLVSGLLLGVLLLATPVFAQGNVQRLNTDGIAKAMGREGELTGEMYKVSFPRSDLTVKVKNLAIKPALSLVGWAGFIKSGSTAITYGDLVLLEDEINPVISKLEEGGVDSSAATSVPDFVIAKIAKPTVAISDKVRVNLEKFVWSSREK
jgi:hypothetical protein